MKYFLWEDFRLFGFQFIIAMCCITIVFIPIGLLIRLIEMLIVKALGSKYKDIPLVEVNPGDVILYVKGEKRHIDPTQIKMAYGSDTFTTRFGLTDFGFRMINETWNYGKLKIELTNGEKIVLKHVTDARNAADLIMHS